MQKVLLSGLVLLAAACGGSGDNQAADTTGAAAAPPALTVADLTGTLNGTTMAETSDSVIGTWTSHITANASGGTEGRFISSLAPQDTVSFTQTISGDSVISESANYNDPQAPQGSGQVHWRAVGRQTSPHQWAGTVVIMPAGMDSVVVRYRWRATHTP
jgi:hypothetical protein